MGFSFVGGVRRSRGGERGGGGVVPGVARFDAPRLDLCSQHQSTSSVCFVCTI